MRCIHSTGRSLANLLQDVNGGLADYERLRMLVVVPEPWTIESGCLTPTMKVRRAAIEASVASQLDGWYASDRPVQWMERAPGDASTPLGTGR